MNETVNEELYPKNSAEHIGENFFKWRDYTPIPLIILLIFFAEPTVISATFGMLLIFFGELIRIYSVAFIGTVSRTRSDSLGEALVDRGPFAYMRNPLYVGNFLISFGIALYSGSLVIMILTVLLFGIQYHYIVIYEEGLLEKKFGEAYERYKETVPPWIPRKLPRLHDLEWPPSFTAALASEKRTLMAIAAMVVVLLLLARGD